MQSLRIPYNSHNLRRRLLGHLLLFAGYGLLLLISMLFLNGTGNWAVYPFIVASSFSLFYISGPSLLEEFRLRNQSTLVALTSKTIALKPPGKPTIYVSKAQCVHYIPSDHTLLTQDGREIYIGKLNLSPGLAEEVLTFLFTHCWPEIGREDYLGIIRGPEMDAWKQIHGDKTCRRIPISLIVAMAPIVGSLLLLRLGYIYPGYAILLLSSAITFWLHSSGHKAINRDYVQWINTIGARRLPLSATADSLEKS